jgi:hypothetical protein
MGGRSKGGELLWEAMVGASRSRRPTRGPLLAILLQIQVENSDKGCGTVAVVFQRLVMVMISDQIYIEHMESWQGP